MTLRGGIVIRDGKRLTPTYSIKMDDKGRFRMEVVPKNFPEGTEFMLSAQFPSSNIFEPEPSVPLFDKKGNLIKFDLTMLNRTLKVGDVTAK